MNGGAGLVWSPVPQPTSERLHLRRGHVIVTPAVVVLRGRSTGVVVLLCCGGCVAVVLWTSWPEVVRSVGDCCWECGVVRCGAEGASRTPAPPPHTPDPELGVARSV